MALNEKQIRVCSNCTHATITNPFGMAEIIWCHMRFRELNSRKTRKKAAYLSRLINPDFHIPTDCPFLLELTIEGQS